MFLLQMLTDLNTYLNKAIPDTRLTIKKYLDVKFEYLVSCLFGFFVVVVWVGLGFACFFFFFFFFFLSTG